MVLGELDNPKQKKEIEPLSFSIYKNKLKMDFKDLNVELKL